MKQGKKKKKKKKNPGQRVRKRMSGSHPRTCLQSFCVSILPPTSPPNNKKTQQQTNTQNKTKKQQQKPHPQEEQMLKLSIFNKFQKHAKNSIQIHEYIFLPLSTIYYQWLGLIRLSVSIYNNNNICHTYRTSFMSSPLHNQRL